MPSSPLRVGRWLMWVSLAGGLAVAPGCNKARPLVASASVPAGEGTVRTTVGDNGNTIVSIRVSHLALPSRVSETATTYVVWIQPTGGAMQNVGALQVNDDLEGRLDFVTPHRQFMLLVTPEGTAQAAYPGPDRVFTSNVQRRG